MTVEFIMVMGTRAEFMAEYGSRLELYAPHIHLVRVLHNNLKLQLQFMHSPAEMKSPTVMVSVSDYAAQYETQRE